MVPAKLVVEVVAPEALGRRITAVLLAGGVAARQHEPAVSGGIRVVSEDLGKPASVRGLRERLARGPRARTLIVSPECGAVGVRRALRAGADSVVIEDELDATLVPAVTALSAGLSTVPTRLRRAADGPALSHREREVLRLAIAGNTNSEIAGTLYLAQSTVKSHLSSAYRKLGAGNRTDAAALILDPEAGLSEVLWPARPHHVRPSGHHGGRQGVGAARHDAPWLRVVNEADD